jgi:hypothetical protein
MTTEIRAALDRLHHDVLERVRELEVELGNGNAATGQYIASGTATTLLWGTNNFMTPTGWLTITKISQKTIVAYKEELPNGDGLTAGQVLGIDLGRLLLHRGRLSGGGLDARDVVRRHRHGQASG